MTTRWVRARKPRRRGSFNGQSFSCGGTELGHTKHIDSQLVRHGVVPQWVELFPLNVKISCLCAHTETKGGMPHILSSQEGIDNCTGLTPSKTSDLNLHRRQSTSPKVPYKYRLRDPLLQTGVFTQLASNIKGFTLFHMLCEVRQRTF